MRLPSNTAAMNYKKEKPTTKRTAIAAMAMAPLCLPLSLSLSSVLLQLRPNSELNVLDKREKEICAVFKTQGESCVVACREQCLISRSKLS